MINARDIRSRREEVDYWVDYPDPNFTCGLGVCTNRHHHVMGPECTL